MENKERTVVKLSDKGYDEECALYEISCLYLDTFSLREIIKSVLELGSLIDCDARIDLLTQVLGTETFEEYDIKIEYSEKDIDFLEI